MHALTSPPPPPPHHTAIHHLQLKQEAVLGDTGMKAKDEERMLRLVSGGGGARAGAGPGPGQGPGLIGLGRFAADACDGYPTETPA